MSDRQILDWLDAHVRPNFDRTQYICRECGTVLPVIKQLPRFVLLTKVPGWKNSEYRAFEGRSIRHAVELAAGHERKQR